ncbi:UNVERIFIED_CONTAM: hypothetical protein Slati_0216100 [Sesamum latifolium]|uniref:Uncharacterized protein n=1 Tax=Sesamum latifolium TaxID=2727402 RepID=A0AAW2YBR4_9LAMI
MAYSKSVELETKMTNDVANVSVTCLESVSPEMIAIENASEAYLGNDALDAQAESR